MMKGRVRAVDVFLGLIVMAVFLILFLCFGFIAEMFDPVGYTIRLDQLSGYVVLLGRGTKFVFLFAAAALVVAAPILILNYLGKIVRSIFPGIIRSLRKTKIG